MFGVAIVILIIIFILTFAFSRNSPGILLSYFLLFSFITNITLDKLGFLQLKYLLAIIILAIYLLNTFNSKALSRNISFMFTSNIFWAVIIVLLGMFLGYLDGGLNERGQTIVSKFLMPIIFMFLIAAVSVNNLKTLEQFSLGIIIWGAMFYVVMYSLVDLSIVDFDYRKSIKDITYFDIHPLARMNAMILIIGIVYALLTKSQMIRIVSIIISLISIFWLIFIAARGETISTVVVLAIFFVYHFKMKSQSILYLMIIFFIVIIFINIIDITRFAFLDRFMQLEYYDKMPRFYDYEKAWEIFKDHIFFGAGPGGYSELTDRNYPHNLFLELMAEYGLIGITASLMILITGIRNSIKILRKQIFNYRINLVVCLWLFYTMTSVTSGSITVNNDFWIMSGVMIPIIYQAKMKFRYSHLAIRKN